MSGPEVDGHQDQATITYDPATGRVAESRSTAYDPNGGPHDQVSTRYYDQWGRVDRVVAPTSASSSQDLVQTIEYDALSRVVKSVARWQSTAPYTSYDPNDRMVMTVYDALGRVSKVGQAKQITAGNPDSDYIWTSNGYDRDGLVLSLTDGNGKTTAWDYVNVPSGGTSALGRLRKMTYPSIGSSNPDEGVAITGYDLNGNPTTIQFRKDMSSAATAIEWDQAYDERNRLTARTAALIGLGLNDPAFPGTTSQAFSYDDAGLLTVALDRAPAFGQAQDIWVENRFDTGGRPIQQTQRMPLNGTGFVDHVVASEFQADGFRSKLTYPASYSGTNPLAPYELTFAPDPLGRLMTITGPASPLEPAVGVPTRPTKELARYSYMGALPWHRLSGNGVEQRYFEGTDSSLYDAQGRIRGIRVVDNPEHSNAQVADFRYGYDRVGNRTYEQRRHEALSDPAGSYRTRTYQTDLLGRLTRQREKPLGSDSMASPIVPMDDADPTDATPPSPGGGTTALAGEAWTLDPLGNWTSFSEGVGAVTTTYYDVNARNQYAAIGPDSTAGHNPVVEYTWLGEIWKDRRADRKYEWDAFGRMTKVYQGTEPGALTATYRYDAFNRRVEKKVETGDVSGDLITRFVYDGWRAIEERGLTGASPNQQERVRARYGFGNGLDELIWMDRDLTGASTAADGTIESRFYVNQDALGSAVVATKERAAASDSLVIAERYTYSAYGSVTTWNGAIPWDGVGYSGAESTSRIGLPYLYTGQRQDAETRNYYYKNRYFDPVMGRFLSRDPIGLGGGPNVYAIAEGGVHELGDPFGLYSASPLGCQYTPDHPRDDSGDLPLIFDSDRIAWQNQHGPMSDSAMDFEKINPRKLPKNTGWRKSDEQIEREGQRALRRQIREEKIRGVFEAMGEGIERGFDRLINPRTSDSTVVAMRASGWSRDDGSFLSSAMRNEWRGYEQDPQWEWAMAQARHRTDVLVGQFASTSVNGALALTGISEGYAAIRAALAARRLAAGAEVLARGAAAAIRTPYALETQSASTAAQAALAEAQSGATLYRMGQVGESMAGESQYWSLTNPLSPGYASQMGMPAVVPNFIMGGTLAPGATIVTNEAAALATNLGGAIQIVVSRGGVTGLWFYMP